LNHRRLEYYLLDLANTQGIPAWTRFDAGVRYTFDRADGKPLCLRYNVENLFDLDYWRRPTRPTVYRWGHPTNYKESLSDLSGAQVLPGYDSRHRVRHSGSRSAAALHLASQRGR